MSDTPIFDEVFEVMLTRRRADPGPVWPPLDWDELWDDVLSAAMPDVTIDLRPKPSLFRPPMVAAISRGCTR